MLRLYARLRQDIEFKAETVTANTRVCKCIEAVEESENIWNIPMQLKLEL